MSSIKRLLQNAFPETYKAYKALRLWWYRLRQSGSRRQLHQMLQVIVAQDGLVVQDGPFRGMRYVPELLDSEKPREHALLPKVLGSYEAELHSVLMEALGRDYKRIVNIGCSEGYYAVGLSLRVPHAHVFAFDTDPTARRLCREMAVLNGVEERVTVASECTTNDLQTLAVGRTLVICDCEGCELELLRPDLAPGLSACDLVVELHDGVDPTISRVVPGRFTATHDVRLLARAERNPSRYSALEQFSRYKQRLAVAEFRWGTQLWAFMTSKQTDR